MSTSSFQRYKDDVAELSKRGDKMLKAMARMYNADREKKPINNDDFMFFIDAYESWYSEALALVSQLLPERKEDFISHYKPLRPRKDLNASNYTISDALRGTQRKSYDGEIIYGPSSAVSPLMQQVNILKALSNRFDSTLYDIRTLVHADLLDDELHAAEVLSQNGYQRGAGAVAGVVIEAHLSAVCVRNSVTLKKKDPTISELSEALKGAGKIDIPQWRFIQHLADIRNKCDHKKTSDPTKQEVEDLIAGVRKITKTIF